VNIDTVRRSHLETTTCKPHVIQNKGPEEEVFKSRGAQLRENNVTYLLKTVNH